MFDSYVSAIRLSVNNRIKPNHMNFLEKCFHFSLKINKTDKRKDSTCNCAANEGSN